LIGQWVKIRTRDHTGQQSYSTPSEASRVFPPELSFFDRKRQRHSERNSPHAGDRYIVVDVVFKCLRQRSNGLKLCLPAVFYMYVFSWFHSV